MRPTAIGAPAPEPDDEPTLVRDHQHYQDMARLNKQLEELKREEAKTFRKRQARGEKYPE